MGMRSHADIIKSYGAKRLWLALVEVGHSDLTQNAVQQWASRSSIAAAYWTHLVGLGVASLEELATAAAKPLPEPSHAAPQHDTGIAPAASGQPVGVAG